jgi:hypothetical protein
MTEELKACPCCGMPGAEVVNLKEMKAYHCINGMCQLYDVKMTLEEWQWRPIENTLSTELHQAKEESKKMREALEKIFNLSNRIIFKVEGIEASWSIEEIKDLNGEIDHLKHPVHTEPGEMSDAFKDARMRVDDETINNLSKENAMLKSQVSALKEDSKKGWGFLSSSEQVLYQDEFESHKKLMETLSK